MDLPCILRDLLVILSAMTLEELAGYIDLTLLKPTATRTDIERLIEGASCFPFASVCIPPCYVALARSMGKGIRVGTVVGFPLGYQTTTAKLLEAAEATGAGAVEVDMVMNLATFKSGEWDMVRDEIAAIITVIPKTVVKVIIEVSYLTDEEKVMACELAVEGGAHYVKTSSGFTQGVRVEDVELLKRVAAGRIKVKASGGIRDLDSALKMIGAGADRIGTSSGIGILEEFIKRAR